MKGEGQAGSRGNEVLMRGGREAAGAKAYSRGAERNRGRPSTARVTKKTILSQR